jgi:hypothetical protein
MMPKLTTGPCQFHRTLSKETKQSTASRLIKALLFITLGELPFTPGAISYFPSALNAQRAGLVASAQFVSGSREKESEQPGQISPASTLPYHGTSHASP